MDTTISEDLLKSISTPDEVETPIGTLQFRDGFPDAATVARVYDNLDFMRGVQVFLNTLPGASLAAMRRGIRSFGPDNQTVIVFETLMDSKSLFLTANTETVYATGWLDTTDGPLVIEAPPGLLGLIDDFWFHYVGDIGLLGPDKGEGGKYLLLPPTHQGGAPEGYFELRSKTFGNWLVLRNFLVDGDPMPAAKSYKNSLRIYPLARAGDPPAMNFVNASGKAFNTIHSTDSSFFEEVNEVVQEEGAAALDPETLGLLASIGIEKGKPFAPNGRMRRILADAAAVGNATARSLVFRSRNEETYYYPASAWMTAFPGGSHEFVTESGARDLDARSFFFYYATGITPAMAIKRVGFGSQYAVAFVDSAGNAFDGGRDYKLHLPPNIPANRFWSLVIYDNQTRSMLQTDQRFPSVGSLKEGIVVNPDTSVDVYFGPKAPADKKANWLQTIPSKGWSVILRLYGPEQAWFDKTWRPGEVELVE